ncbi:sodium/proline symporter PutP [Dialister succinatiphilus]|jgi:sodium/proline symporter|uniref:Sodium/proline symporter n=2 Tax=Dialister succinatiphilus TaxID=487173 RepID=H1CZ71_9FIRM|nr:sodium/proline symporter PutP [Dialister succinatiphilus]EHO63642.1 sodium/proline symporter [Dialister succinatiphilus YIT 11850]
MDLENNWPIALAFILYLVLMMSIGLYYSRRQKNLSSYILGDRQLGPWLTSMSAEASDMSGWMLMGLPGYAYLHGLSAFWTGIGLIVGTWANWVLVSQRLRNYTEVADNSLTIPDYLSNRFEDRKNGLRLICALFIILFFIIYTSSGFVAAGKLFNTIFGIPYLHALLLGAFVVVFYTFLGGFSAVALTDFIQGTMMFFTVLYVPVAATIALGGPMPTLDILSKEGSDFFSFFPDSTGISALLVMIVSSLGWGLGYFGQPHILVKFMAIGDPKELKKSTRIAMTWVLLSLSFAIAIGVVGKAYLSTPLENANAERVFILMAESLSAPFITGIIWSAILAAIMSTSSSQLLVTSSAVSRDLFQAFLKKDASEKTLIRVSRLSVLLVSAIAVYLGSDPNSYIFSIVSYAWAGFGACFGATVLLSLYWKRMTLKGAYAGVIVGGLTVLIWKHFEWFGLYELVPGFFFSVAAIVIVSLMDKKPSETILKTFEKAMSLSK